MQAEKKKLITLIISWSLRAFEVSRMFKYWIAKFTTVGPL